MIHDVLMKTEKEKTKKKKREKKENSCLEVLISWVSEDSERIMGLYSCKMNSMELFTNHK